MEPLRGYDAWKTRVPDVPSGGVRDQDAWKHTRMLWWRAYRSAKRNGTLAAWLDQQRQVPLFAPLVKEADAIGDR